VFVTEPSIDAREGRGDLGHGAVQIVHPRLQRDREVDEIVLAASEEDDLVRAQPADLGEQVNGDAERHRGRTRRADRDPGSRAQAHARILKGSVISALVATFFSLCPKCSS
jgi:hypothetical protein